MDLSSVSIRDGVRRGVHAVMKRGSTRPVPEGDSSCCDNSCSVTGLLHGTCVPAPQLRKGWPNGHRRFSVSGGGWGRHASRPNVAAVVDMNGGLLGVESFPTTADGHRRCRRGCPGSARSNGSGSRAPARTGRAVARTFAAADVAVIEVDRPNRQKRRQHGKSDQLDAIEAARGTLSGRCDGRAKSGDAHAEALRALLVAERSARSTRIRTIVQLRHLMFTAPDDLRPARQAVAATQLVNECRTLRPRLGGDIVRVRDEDRQR